MAFEFGKVARITLAVVDPVTGQPTDPPNVTLTVTKPDATTTTPSPTHPGVGSFYADVLLDQGGDWRWVWESNATQVLDEGATFVSEQYVQPAWTPSLDQVAAHVPARTIETGDVTGTPRGTFTGLTFPTAAQVDQFVREATAFVAGGLGDTAVEDVMDLATTAAALRAAASVEMVQHEDNRDEARIAALLRQSDLVLAQAAETTGGVTPGVESRAAPVWAFPEPVEWGDEVVL